MDIFHAVVLGIVEGLTEFLPVSSTGHLILVADLFGLPETEFLKTFEIAIQSGAILAVVALYWRRLLLDRRVLYRVMAAFVPTGVLGLIFYEAVKQWLGSESVVLWALFLGGVALIVFEAWHRERDDALPELAVMPYHTAVALGLFQALALIPGVSRSGATIVGGLLLGLRRTAVVEFSFLLAVPTMVAATGFDLLRHAGEFSAADSDSLVVGFVVSFVVALVAVKWLIGYVRTHTFTAFGVYRIAVAVVFFWWMAR